MFKLSRKVLCLDWDRQALRLVVAHAGGGRISLEDAHAHRLPAAVDPDNPQALGEFIHQMLRRHHWNFTRAVVDIPRDRAVINRLTLPPTPTHEVAAAVRFQAMKELPFPLDNAVVDYVIMKRDEKGLTTEVLLAAVTLDALEAVRATCEAAGLEPERIGLRPYANLLSISHLPGLVEQRVLFVDVGPTMTEIDVMERGQLAFARSANVNVPVGGEGAAEDSRIMPAADLADLESSDEALEAAVRELTVEITRTLQAYRATEPDAVLDRIVIAGSTGLEVALRHAVDQRFGLASSLFDPTDVLEVRREEAVKLRSFSAALGLAWGLEREGALAIDFLNPKRPVAPRETLKRRLRIGGLAAAAVLAAVIGTDVALYVRASARLSAQRAHITALRSQFKEKVLVQNLVDEVRDWQREAVWPEELLRLTQNAVNPGKDMLVQQMALDYRTATISMKRVLLANLYVPKEFANRLNELLEEGTHPYRATPGSYKGLQGADGKFSGTDDIQVEVCDLKQHHETRDIREKARKARAKGL